MADTEHELHDFDRQAVWAGFSKLMPISLFVVVFGAAFGLAANQARRFWSRCFLRG